MTRNMSHKAEIVLNEAREEQPFVSVAMSMIENTAELTSSPHRFSFLFSASSFLSFSSFGQLFLRLVTDCKYNDGFIVKRSELMFVRSHTPPAQTRRATQIWARFSSH